MNQLDHEREAFGHWAESMRAKYPDMTVEAYNFARDSWLEAKRREREAAAVASGMARRAADRTGEELLAEHVS
jgi:hypothetical protein